MDASRKARYEELAAQIWDTPEGAAAIRELVWEVEQLESTIKTISEGYMNRVRERNEARLREK